MKKLLQIPLLLVALFLISIPISAHDFEVDDIYYSITDETAKTVKVTYYDLYNNGYAYSGEVSIPSSVTYNGITYSVTEIGGYAFSGCTGLTSVTIPNSVTSIGESAFYYCSGLTSVTIPNSVTSIDYSAFEGCTGLKELIIEDGTKDLSLSYNYYSDYYSGEGLFYDCPLENLYLGRNLLYDTSGKFGYSPFHKITTLKSVTIGNSVKKIDRYAFSGCSGLTSVTIPNSVTEIGYSAFEGCTGLTSVTIPNSVTSIGDEAFYECSELTSITIPNSVTSIGYSAFEGCTGLTSVTIPNSVTSIGNEAFYGTGWYNNQPDGILYLDNCCLGYKGSKPTGSLLIKKDTRLIGSYAFRDCSGLTSVTIGNSVTSIGYCAFYGCTGLASYTITVNQISATLTNLSTPTQYTPYFQFLNKYYKSGDKITGLTPDRKYDYYYGLIINGIYCQIGYDSFTTSQFNVNLSGSATASSVSATGSYTQGDATLVGEGLNLGSEVTNFDNKNNVTFENLDPNTSYTVYYGVKIKENTSTYTTSETFTTEALNWVNGRYDATSTTSARLIVETNCDATLGTGYEWRRIDAPDIIASSKVECPVVNGMLVGSLRNLNPDVYYKCRPYYTSASGNTYYGDWVGFYTADANVYFSPEVLTYSNVAVNNNSAVVKGYALEGTDVITAQGFEYWKTGTTIKPASTDDRKVVNASGIAMSATLTNLDYNSTYKYRAFVTTEKGTVYGDEIEFSTGDDPAGIGYIEIDNDELTVTLRENPATGTAWVKIAGATGGEAQYAITSMSGSMVACGRVMLEDEWNAIELDCPSGLYLLTINDGKQVKTLRLIVK